MALSSCPKCNSSLFEVSEAEPIGSSYKLNFVQCATCGAVVGVLDYFNIGALTHKQNEALKKIARTLKVSVDL